MKINNLNLQLTSDKSLNSTKKLKKKLITTIKVYI